jgi:serine/threonine protein kinase HipA of HipAB toxin-antitoxin module
MASDRRNTETHCHYTGLPSVESYDKDFPVNQELLEKYHELTRGLH